MKTLADLTDDELQTRAAAAMNLPDLPDDETSNSVPSGGPVQLVGYGQVAVTSDPWLRDRANDILRSGLPPAPEPIDAIRGLDDDTMVLILVTAVRELQVDTANLRAWNPAQHKRWPKGHPLAGKFRPMVDLVKEAIAKFDGKGKPLQHFKRDQILKAAKDLGISVQRGESEDSIAAKLVASIGLPKSAKAKPSSPATPAPAPSTSTLPAAPPGKPVVTTVPSPGWPAGQGTGVFINGRNIGVVVLDPSSGIWMPFGLKAHAKGRFKNEQDAIDALVDAATPKRVSGPGLSGRKLTEMSVIPKVAGWNNSTDAKWSLEIADGGTPIGTVHNWGYGYTADDPAGQTVWGPNGATFNTKSQAIAALVAKANPAPQAPAAAGTPAPPPPGDAELDAAVAVLFGTDPKGHTIARQLAVYGALRRHQFDQLGPAEQTTMLGDLAFIFNTASAGNKLKAQKILDRFTPPGTPPGTVPKQGVYPPASAVPGQTRLPDPAGVAGMLKVRQDRGQSGDGWTTLPSGKRGPWGKYGAAGVMLRHVDPVTGEERFLMVERGPGISDPGKWQFPGGAIDSKENPHEGAARETVEELGLDAADMAGARVHGHHEVTIPGAGSKAGGWKYTSIVATVDRQLVPDLSTHHAQMETSDAKWMTRAEIEALDTKGKLLSPLAGGQLQANVMSLFPSPAPAGAGGPVTSRPDRLSGTPNLVPRQVFKKSVAVDLMPDDASKNKLRQDVKKARSAYAGKVADDRLAAIGALQGFDRTPTVASKAEMDRLLATGDYIEAWRGVRGSTSSSWGRATRGGAVSQTKTAAQITEEFRSGVSYYGIGVFGNGYYFATSRSVAAGYADGTKGSLVRVLIPKSAKMADHAKMLAETKAASGPRSKAKGVTEDGTLWDEGRYAAARGFDMIEITPVAVSRTGISSSHVASRNRPSFNILNRSILIVEEA